MSQRILTVKVIGDDRDVQRMWERQGRQARTAQTSYIGAGTALKAGLGAAGIAVGLSETFDLLKRSVGQASALNEEVAKSEEVFGSSSAGVQRWSQTTADSLGIAQVAALQATGIFGNLFRTVELAPDQAAEMSKTLVQLAADLASFNNASPDDVLQAIRSGLIGEAEPLRRYGVLLSEARVQQVALAATGKDNVRQLTDQEKALARYQIILDDTVTAQGDVQRTQGSLANQSRRLSAQWQDLSADVGGVLIPALTLLAQTGNIAFDSLERLADIELLGLGGTTLGEAAGWASGWTLLNRSIREVSDSLRDVDEAASGVQPGIGGAQRAASRRGRAEAAARETERETREANRSSVRRQKAFDEFVRGMGLKLNRAQLTEGFADDIAALEELERAIQRQIRREGRTFDLVEQLTDTRLRLASLRGSRSQRAAQAASDAYAEIIGSLNLRLTQALRTASLEDDLRALAELESAIRRRIAAEGRTSALLAELDSIRAQRADTLRQQRERQRSTRQANQFLGLGLTEEGEERIAGSRALRRRSNRLENQIKGTVLDTKETRTQLDQIQSVLSGKFGEVGRNVRRAIEGMLDEIAGALEGGGKRGPITATSGLNTRKILEGMGLSEEEIRELRGRLSSVNSGGRVLGSGAPLRAAGTGAGPPTGRHIEIDNYVTVEIDGQKVAAAVTRQQQKTKRRNPKQKRGANRNR